MSEQSRDTELGACWIKIGKKGEYMTGEITIDGVKTQLVFFPNTNKSKDTQPDWRIHKSQPMSGERAQGFERRTTQVAAPAAAQDDDDSIPF